MTRRTITTPCTITVNHTFDSLEAHVELAGGVSPDIGDRVLVHGAPVQARFGESFVLEREATVFRANALQKLLIKIQSFFELTELYEVSFTAGRLK